MHVGAIRSDRELCVCEGYIATNLRRVVHMAKYPLHSLSPLYGD